jgi:hypothetical protein
MSFRHWGIAMDWCYVRIPGRRSANAWMALARAVHQDAGFPPDCSIHLAVTPDAHLLYFSPECAAVFSQLLKLLGASPCGKPSGIENLTQVLQLSRSDGGSLGSAPNRALTL